jgi:hypothetical protein
MDDPVETVFPFGMWLSHLLASFAQSILFVLPRFGGIVLLFGYLHVV